MRIHHTAAMLLTVMLAACQATNTSFTKPHQPEQALQKVMVMALTNQYPVREMWEKEMAYRLRKRGYNAITSVGLDESRTKQYTKEELPAIVQQHRIDGIFALRLKEVDKKEGYTQSDRYISDPYGGIYMYNYLDSYMNVRGWQYQLEQKVTIEGKMYEIATEKLVLEAVSSMTNAESDEALAGEITETLAKATARSKVMEQNK